MENLEIYVIKKCNYCLLLKNYLMNLKLNIILLMLKKMKR